MRNELLAYWQALPKDPFYESLRLGSFTPDRGFDLFSVQEGVAVLRRFGFAVEADAFAGLASVMGRPATSALLLSTFARDPALARWSYAIPDEEAIQTLVGYSPVVEIGAGNGYWARLVSDAGGDIVAYDLRPWRRRYFEVRQGGTSSVRLHPRRTLFLCWPPYNEQMALEAVALFRGDRLIYVGEQDGCTADEAFHYRLQRDWQLTRSVRIPTWPGIHDAMRIYRRR